ncbi:MAG: transporter substrate-binding domain-containing protein [Clostridiales bacterium]|nr:MAG: transporter substrate-binding domain-containing protein [Clostridiales bacterium]
MKKILAALLTVATVITCAFAFTACDKKGGGATEKIKMVDVDLSSEQYAFIVKKEDAELLNTVNGILDAKATEIQAIMDKYLNATEDQLATFGSNSIKTSATAGANELVVATNIDFAPFEYYNGNKIAGIDIEIAHLIANEMGKTLVVEHMDFDAVVTSVQTKEIYDIGMAALTISADRAEMVNFTKPYFDTTQVVVVKADDTTFDAYSDKDAMLQKLAFLSGAAAKCGGQTGTTGQQFVKGNEALGFDGFKNLDFNGYDSPALAVQSMLDGNISFIIVDKAVAQTLLKNVNK